MIDVHDHNRIAWNDESRRGESPWCEPVAPSVIAEARAGRWSVILTPVRKVPREWFDDIAGKRVLCLASGGGQQAPVLAAAGAKVTSFDISEAQLALDQFVAKRDGLSLETVRGDMSDLSCFESAQFDLIFHPTSNLFVRDIRIVWNECHRVLNNRGRLLAGFMNPDYFLFDHDALEQGRPLNVVNRLPYREVDDTAEDTLRARIEKREALEFSHSLDDQIGGQLDAGFSIAGFYEDRWSDEATRLNEYMPTSIATLSIKAA